MAVSLLRAVRVTRRSARHAAVSTQRRHAAVVAPFEYEKLFDYDANPVETPYRKLKLKGVSSTSTVDGEELLTVSGKVLERLAKTAIIDIQHLFRPTHLQQVANILKDPEASANDRFVALELLKNACVSAGKIMPSCQDTGTATIMATRGGRVLTDGNDEKYLSKGVYRAYTEGYLRYSQVAPVSMFNEVNTRTNLPAQIDMMTKKGASYDFLFVAKGGGSANKAQLVQKTKGVLNEKAFTEFVTGEIVKLGTAACPPYHLAICVGGLSAEQNLKVTKLASCKYLDGLPTTGSKGGRAFRDLEWEEKCLKISQDLEIGAQFGGKYFMHDARVIRLPRHGASCPIGIGVSCSADRQIKAKITKDGVFLEKLETDPAKYLPDVQEGSLETGGEIVKINLNNPMEENLKILSAYPVATRLALTGTIIVARDIAHAKMQEMLDRNEPLPDYMQKYPVYYAGPAKTPAGMPSGSFGPTTSGRMDAYVDSFQSMRGSMIMIGKGNRSPAVTSACKRHGGFYLGSIGGVAATLSSNSIKKVDVLDMEELGMEAVWRIEVEDFPAFVIVDDKGNDFFKRWSDSSPAGVPIPIEEDSHFSEHQDVFYGLDDHDDNLMELAEVASHFEITEEAILDLLRRFNMDASKKINVMQFEKHLIEHLKSGSGGTWM